MVLTIVEAAKLAANNGEDKKAALLEIFAAQSPLLRAMPMVPITGNSYAWDAEAVLPSAAFRAVNGTYTASEGKIEKRTEALKIVGGELDVDVALVKTNGPRVRSVHEAMKAKALADQIGYSFVQGSAASDPTSLDGLAYRFPLGGSRDVPNVGASNAMSFKYLDTAIQTVDNPTHLLMPKKQRVNMSAYLRSGGTSILESRREFGQLIFSYGGLDILDADMLGTTAALSYGEASSTCSIFVLDLSESGLHAITNGGFDVRDLGEISSAPVYRTRVEALIGLVDEHPRCVARLSNVADLTAVA